jgi:pyridoxamine 5'-phosphate oxidase
MPDIDTHLRDVRKDYAKSELHFDDLAKDPFQQFQTWLADAIAADPEHANAMVLATADEENWPDARVVLLRDIRLGGFSFYTNYLSKKGIDIAQNPKASLLFFWPQLERQVRISGSIEKMSHEDADAYFAQRPFESKVGAWASLQSSVIEDRRVLDAAFETQMNHFKTLKDVPRPPYWGGYLVKPQRVEFWQGRASRLHDRLRYTLNAIENKWIIERLMP